MATEVDIDVLLSTKRDLLTKFITDFNEKQAALKTAVSAVDERIATAIAAENAESAAIVQIQKQLDGLSLAADLSGLQAIQTDITTKMTTYTDLVAANNKAAATIYEAISASQSVIDEITKTIADINANIASINNTLDAAKANVLTLA